MGKRGKLKAKSLESMVKNLEHKTEFLKEGSPHLLLTTPDMQPTIGDIFGLYFLEK